MSGGKTCTLMHGHCRDNKAPAPGREIAQRLLTKIEVTCRADRSRHPPGSETDWAALPLPRRPRALNAWAPSPTKPAVQPATATRPNGILSPIRGDKILR